MRYYAIAETNATDRSWVAEYIRNVTRLVEQHGGRFLARTSKIQKIEGERSLPQVLSIIEWPSEKAFKAFYESDEYRPYRQSRIQGAGNEFVLVAGEDATRAAKASE